MIIKFVCTLVCVSLFALATVSGAVVKVVKTRAQLMDAVLAGETHVHITEHMDLRGVTPQYQTEFDSKLIHAPESLASLSVRVHLASYHAPCPRRSIGSFAQEGDAPSP